MASHASYLFLLCGYFLMLGLVTRADKPFDCRRSGQPCNRPDVNTCNVTNGLCDCGGRYAGDNCDQFPPAIDPTVDCSGNGAGYPTAQATPPLCLCYPGYHGASCQLYYIFATCDNTSMELKVNPVGTFTGKIYVENKLELADCQLSPISSPVDGFNGFSLNISYNDSVCGDAVWKGPADPVYSRTFVIQYLEYIVTVLDELVTVECDPSPSNATIVTSTINDSSITIARTGTGVRGNLNPITVVSTMNGQVVTDTTTVLIRAKICTTLSVTQELAGLEIRSIIFKNDTQVSNPVTLLVYKDGCRVNGTESVVTDLPHYPVSSDKTKMEFCFSAFKFSNSDLVVMELVVKICVNASQCNVQNCPGNRIGKRDAGDEDKMITTVFHITDEEQTLTSDKTKDEAKTYDQMPMEVITIVASLCGVLLAFIIVLMLVLYKIIKGETMLKENQKK